MIRLNVSVLIPDSSKAGEMIEKAVDLVAFSLRDSGCIGYDVYRSLTNDDRLIIIETWKDEESLKKHQETEHFKRLVPELEQLGTLTLERFDF